MWVVLLIAATNRKYHPDLRSDPSSVRNFRSRFVKRHFAGNHRWREEMWAVFSGEQNFTILVVPVHFILGPTFILGLPPSFFSRAVRSQQQPKVSIIFLLENITYYPFNGDFFYSPSSGKKRQEYIK